MQKKPTDLCVSVWNVKIVCNMYQKAHTEHSICKAQSGNPFAVQIHVWNEMNEVSRITTAPTTTSKATA